MSIINELRTHLDETESLINSLASPDIRSFQERLKAIRHELDQLPTDASTAEKEKIQSRTLRQEVQLNLVNVMISQLQRIESKDGLLEALLEIHQKMTEAKRFKTVEFMKKIIQSFIELTIPPRIVKASDAFELKNPTPPAILLNEAKVEHIATPKKPRKKATVATITENPAIEKEALSRALNTQITEKESQRQQLKADFISDALVEEDSSVPLIAHNLKVIASSEQELDAQKNTISLLRTQLEMMAFFKRNPLLHIDFKTLSDEQKNNMVKWFNALPYFEVEKKQTVIGQLWKRITKPKTAALTIEQLDAKHIKTMADWLAGQDQATEFKMPEKVFNLEKDYLAALERHLPLMTKATELIKKALNELDTNTEAGKRLSALKLSLTELSNGIDELNKKNEENFDSVMTSDQAVTALLGAHELIYLRQSEGTDETIRTLKAIKDPHYFHQVPLETERTLALIERLTSFRDHLVSINNALENSRNDIFEHIESRNQKALDAQANVERRINDALKILEDISKFKIHVHLFKTEIDHARFDLLYMLQNEMANDGTGHFVINAARMNEADIEKKLTTFTHQIDEIMNPVWTALGTAQTAFNAAVQETQLKLRRLKEEATGTICETDISSYVKASSHQLESFLVGGWRPIVDLKYTALNTLNASIEIKAKALHDMWAARLSSPRHVLIKNMIQSITVEINAINDTKDARTKILKKMRLELKKASTAYLKLAVDDGTFINHSIEIIERNLSPAKLKGLSDEVLHPLVLFIRKLLQPLTNFIKSRTGETYRPHFFATQTEVNIAKAAETTHSGLNRQRPSN